MGSIDCDARMLPPSVALRRHCVGAPAAATPRPRMEDSSWLGRPRRSPKSASAWKSTCTLARPASSHVTPPRPQEKSLHVLLESSRGDFTSSSLVALRSCPQGLAAWRLPARPTYLTSLGINDPSLRTTPSDRSASMRPRVGKPALPRTDPAVRRDRCRANC